MNGYLLSLGPSLLATGKTRGIAASRRVISETAYSAARFDVLNTACWPRAARLCRHRRDAPVKTCSWRWNYSAPGFYNGTSLIKYHASLGRQIPDA